MAEAAPIVHIGENSPQQVAFKLAETIARIEGRLLYKDRDDPSRTVDRKWLLDTYSECLEAVSGLRRKTKPWPSETI